MNKIRTLAIYKVKIVFNSIGNKNPYNVVRVTNSNYFISDKDRPTTGVPSKPTEAVKVRVIVVSVGVALISVGFVVLVAICLKRRLNYVLRFAYRKLEVDMSLLETAADL